MKTETGVMVMKDGKAWGIIYKDGSCTSYGWVDPDDAEVYNPKYCTSVTSVTYTNSPYTKELLTGELVNVKRVTIVETI